MKRFIAPQMKWTYTVRANIVSASLFIPNIIYGMQDLADVSHCYIYTNASYLPFVIRTFGIPDLSSSDEVGILNLIISNLRVNE